MLPLLTWSNVLILAAAYSIVRRSLPFILSGQGVVRFRAKTHSEVSIDILLTQAFVAAVWLLLQPVAGSYAWFWGIAISIVNTVRALIPYRPCETEYTPAQSLIASAFSVALLFPLLVF